MKNSTLYEYLADNYDITPDEKNYLILAIEDYKDQKQDARIDELGRVLNKSYSWIAIIGFVYLVKIISTIILIAIYGVAIKSLLEAFM